MEKLWRINVDCWVADLGLFSSTDHAGFADLDEHQKNLRNLRDL